jgi:F-type H+-transporting ATPase subunit delta
MQGASRAALRELTEALPSRGNAQTRSDELFEVVTLLGNQGSLRRALSDPSSPAEGKQGIVDALLGERLHQDVVGLVRQAAGLRWSSSRDLVDALEQLAVLSALSVAEKDGSLDEVEDELFRFERIVAAEPQLRAALTDRALPDDRKSELLDRLVKDKVKPITFGLLRRAVLSPRGRTLERVVADLTTLAAARRDRLVARVTSATELDDDQQAALAEALSRAYDRQVDLQIVVDDDLIGGLTVRIGDELIDGSVARQLDEARRRLTGRSGAGARRT